MNLSYHILPQSLPALENFYLYNFQLTSEVLKKNPLKDPFIRNNPILVPKNWQKTEKLPVVFVLSGFSGNGTKLLADKGFEPNFVQQLDDCFSRDKAPLAIYVLVDAWSFWGGSQFINSSAIGHYEDYIVQELYAALALEFPIRKDQVCVTGVSSGGYGALHLSSKYPHIFNYCGAMAPDSFFQTSMLNEIYMASPFLLKNNNYKKLIELHKQGKILKQREAHAILNVICMTACYSPHANGKNVDWPVDFRTGEIQSKIWQKWEAHDPLYFLPKRSSQLKKLKGLYLEVGTRDQFYLYFGARLMHDFFKSKKIKHHYNEFDGTHFDFFDRRPEFWLWLKERWA